MQDIIQYRKLRNFADSTIRNILLQYTENIRALSRQNNTTPSKTREAQYIFRMTKIKNIPWKQSVQHGNLLRDVFCFTAYFQICILLFVCLYSPGVIPVNLRKTFEKWDWLQKPTATAISWKVMSLVSIRLHEAWTRCSIKYLWIVVPIYLRKT